jgi:hypothetical protein
MCCEAVGNIILIVSITTWYEEYPDILSILPGEMKENKSPDSILLITQTMQSTFL